MLVSNRSVYTFITGVCGLIATEITAAKYPALLGSSRGMEPILIHTVAELEVNVLATGNPPRRLMRQATLNPAIRRRSEVLGNCSFMTDRNLIARGSVGWIVDETEEAKTTYEST